MKNPKFVELQKTNHPAKGSMTKVEPIKSLKDINTLKKLLENQPRNYAMFMLGINTNLRASDLVRLTVGQFRHLKAEEHIRLIETKTGKERNITINKSLHKAVTQLLSTMPEAADSDPLFQSHKTKVALTEIAITALVKSWCKAINLKGNYGSHTLRKTFGYIQRTVFNADLPTLTEIFNHASQKQCLEYLCIQPEEIRAIYLNEI